MSGTASRPPAAGAVTALTVHGPRGVVDLVVPTGATLAEVARAYADEAGLATPLPLVSRSGRPLQPADEVGRAGLVSGSVLVAVDPAARPAPEPAARSRPGPATGHTGEPARRGPDPGPGSATWLGVAVAAAAVAGWCASRIEADDRWPAVAVLLAAAVLGCVPVGSLARQRALAAPAFAAAACFAVVWDPAPTVFSVNPSVANRNIPAAMKRSAWCCPLPPPRPATSTMEPRLPSFGIAFIATPAAP
ncbi:hypothetical protein, partial [Nocardioides sp. SYSU DS0651]|uniref:hypothetical protein n=1 Tax=Nocardioides sp. SYSU DS0651 TaxID=3415955 RepID=UPI003F4B7DBA